MNPVQAASLWTSCSRVLIQTKQSIRGQTNKKTDVNLLNKFSIPFIIKNWSFIGLPIMG